MVIGNYTLFSDYRNCPHKAYHRHIARDLPQQAQTPEMRHGIRVHEACEHRINGGARLAEDLQPLEEICAYFDELGALAEVKLAMTKQGEACDYKDPGAYVRGKLDIVITDPDFKLAHISDWKTGKVREDAFELAVHAMLLKANLPSLTEITAQYLWTAQLFNVLGVVHDVSNTVIVRNVADSIMANIEFNLRTPGDKHWVKQQNPLCGWCPVRSCEFNTVDKRAYR